MPCPAVYPFKSNKHTFTVDEQSNTYIHLLSITVTVVTVHFNIDLGTAGNTVASGKAHDAAPQPQGMNPSLPRTYSDW
jgi:hypothetical protein